MVAAKIQKNKGGNGCFGGIGQIDEDVHLRSAYFACKAYRHLLAGGQAGQCFSIEVKDLEGHIVQAADGRATINMGSEQLEYFRPAPGPPRSGVGHNPPVRHHQRVGQSVFRDPLLVIIGLGSALGKRLGQLGRGFPALLSVDC